MAIDAAPWQLALAIPTAGVVAAIAWGGAVMFVRRTIGGPMTTYSVHQIESMFPWLEEAFIGLISAMLTFGWVAGTDVDRTYLVETSYLQGTQAAASGLPA